MVCNDKLSYSDEERIPLESLPGNAQPCVNDLTYSYGVLTLYGSSIAFIKPAYYHNSYSEKIDYSYSETVFFNSPKATVIGYEDTLNTYNYLYLVRYVDGGLTINPRTGEEQPTINYNVPVEVLMTCGKKRCLCLYLDDDRVIIKKSASANVTVSPNSATNTDVCVDTGMITDIRAALDADITKQGFVYASRLPKIVEECCKTKFLGKVEAFVKKHLSTFFRYESTYTINGKVIPGAILPNEHSSMLIPYSEIENGDTFAVGGGYTYGIIDYCSKAKGFINMSYGASKKTTRSERSAGKSVIFSPSQVTIRPQGRYLDTKDNIYLVRYATNGTAVNTKSGKEHPALDYSVPITILQEYPRFMYSSLVILEDGVLYTEKAAAKQDFNKCISKLSEAITEFIEEAKYMQASIFPEKAKSSGITNFREYADGVEAFINKFLPKFEVKTNKVIGGTRYPGIIIMRDSWPIFEDEISDAPEQTEDDKHLELQELQQLFEKGSYIDYLRSPQLTSINFCDLPRYYQEMSLTCAARILFGDNTQAVTLDLLQKELIDCANGTVFYKKWSNSGSGYPPMLVESLIRTSWKEFVYDESNNILSVLNSVGRCTKQNDNYKGLCTRFALCYDKLTPCMFFIRIATAISENQKIEPLREYCQIVKDMQPKQHNSWSNTQKLFCLPNLLAGLLEVFPEIQIPVNLITNIASTYVDCNCFDDFGEVLDILDQYDSEFGLLWDLYRNANSWNHEDIVRFLQGTISNKQLFQKTIALLWKQFSEEIVLPDYFLFLLSWVLVADNNISADEFLRYQNTQDFNKRHKQNQLIASLNRICELLPQKTDLYVLATYIIYVVAEDVGERMLPSNYDSLVSTVRAHGDTAYADLLEALRHTSFADRYSICRLFNMFHYDFSISAKLQADYSAWYRSSSNSQAYSEAEYREELYALYNAGLYDTYIALYTEFTTHQSDNQPNDAQFEKFIFAHMNLQRFPEAIRHLEGSAISSELKRVLTIQMLAENFRVNTLSEKAFAIFNDTFSIDTAESFLMEQIQDKSNQPRAFQTVNSLLPIYCHRKDFCKAIYLYKIYQPRAEIGYTRLYSRIRSAFPNVAFGNINNFYDVIELSFFTLNADDLLAFLKWTKLIPVPDFKEIKRTHAFSYHYDKFIDNVQNHLHWRSFLAHLIKRPTMNMWQIVVCEAIIKKLTGNANMVYSGDALNLVLDQEEAKKLPFNLLPFALSYIMKHQNEELCDKLIIKLLQPDVSDRLLAANPWGIAYTHTYRIFKAFALKQHTKTGEAKYSNLIAALPTTDDAVDFDSLSQHTDSLQLVVSQLCSNYLTNTDIHMSVEFLNNIDRQQLSYRDSQLADLLGILFDEDENLLEQYPQIFSDETEVRRVKADCASILSKYPQKDGIVAFERTCINPTHKLIVYSFVFRGLYDEDIYHLPTYSLDSLDISTPTTYYAYAYFMRTVLLSQLQWNTAYQHFYKIWRYLKLYICETLISPLDHVDDSFIIDAMIQYDHYEATFRSEYAPFRDDVNTFLRTVSLPKQVKQYLLVALMSGKVTWFLRNHAALLHALTAEEKSVIRRISSRLDYREASYAVYSLYSDQIQRKDMEEAVSVGSAFSEHIVAALDALNHTDLYQPRDMVRLCELTLLNPPSTCIRNIMKTKPAFFTRYSSVLIPVMFSRQFSFQLYSYFRGGVLRNRKNSEAMNFVMDRFEGCAAYYEQSGRKNARKVYLYLAAFRYCLQGMRKEAHEILTSAEIENGIPEQWLAEAQLIRDYAFGTSMEFRPAAIDDSSQTSNITNNQYTFVQILQAKLGVAQHHLSKEVIGKIAGTYQNMERPHAERLRDGVMLLVNYSDIQNDSEAIPSRDALLLTVGLIALKMENMLPADEQLTTAVELFNGYYGNIESTDKKMAAQFNDLLDTYKMILNRNLPLTSWVQHAKSIRRYLTAIREAGDFGDMVDRILLPCQTLLSPDCSNEMRLREYHALLEQLKLIHSVYAVKIDSAIRKELELIESGIRLRISLSKNEEGSIISTDGYVYYEIVNIGSKTALLNNTHLLFQQENLRPQTLHPAEQCGITEIQCGFMTGGRLRLTSNIATESVQISLRLMDAATKQILSDTVDTVVLTTCSDCFTIGDDHKYSCTGKNEYLSPSMLFGRREQKRLIRKKLEYGIATIYGPSRIGKSSLLNWVEQEEAKSGKILTILFGGEGGLGKGKDYFESFAKSEYPEIPYTDNYQMSEYLLTQTIIHALTDKTDRLNYDDPRELLPPDKLNHIVSILKDTSLSIVQRYSDVNRVLEKAHVELWLMLDEFQDVVEQWRGITLSCDFVEVCNRLQNPRNKIKQIKLIFCGSDDLVRHMAIKDKSVWRDTLWDSRVPVGPLDETSFNEMMRKDHGISDSNIHYSDEALHALFTYTGGVALYGKEIGNVIISNIKNSPDDYRNRNIIHISDVAAATQQLLSQQNHELVSEIRDGIREIYDAVTKNLKFETDKQFLWYIAKWLHENPDHDKFPESEFTGRELVHGDAVLRDSLTIAVERKIIKYVEANSDGNKLYSFCTIFYYNAFFGTFDGNLNEDLIFAREPIPVEEFIPSKEKPADTIKRLWPQLDDYDQSYALGGMATSAKSPAVREALKQFSGNSYQGDDRRVTINIANTLNGILVASGKPADILSSLQSLPRLSAYLGDNESLVLNNLDSDDPNLIVEAEAKLEESTTKMVADYLAALVSRDETPENFCVWKQLGIFKSNYDNLSKAIAPSFMAELILAAKLDYIFDLAECGQESSMPLPDYSPVSIMYCKILEKMLKYYHTRIYSTRLGNASTEVKLAGKKVKFGDLLHMDEAERIHVQNQILLGAFLYPINPEYEHDWSRIANNQTYQISMWRKHGEMLSSAKNIRNESAHGADGVSVDKDKLLKLKNLLFNDEGLMNITVLCE